MTATPVDFIAATRFPDVAGLPAADRVGADFQGWLTHELGRVNQQLATADSALQQLARGETQNLHQVMIALEEARLSFQLLVQVRTRLLEAYQDTLRMQI